MQGTSTRARAHPVLCLSRVLPRKPEPVYHILADGVITLSTVVGISPAAAPGVNKFTARLAAARVKQQSATLFFLHPAGFAVTAEIRRGNKVTRISRVVAR